MAYNTENLTKLGALKELAQRVGKEFATKEDVSALSGKVDDLITTGGEPNVITAVKVNGSVQEVADKAVDITVPTKVSELSNDGNFQSDTQVATAIQTAIAASGHAQFQKVDTIPTAEEAVENVMYLVRNNSTQHFDIYAKVGESVELLDDTTVDLSGYVEKEEGKGLSANDFTDTEKEKLGSIEIATAEEVSEMLDEVFGSSEV